MGTHVEMRRHQSVRSTSVQVHVVDHPLAAVQLTALRDERTARAQFRPAMDQLSSILIYEAT
nr:hypothetical protein [Micromonospora sp. DSM 115978]